MTYQNFAKTPSRIFRICIFLYNLLLEGQSRSYPQFGITLLTHSEEKKSIKKRKLTLWIGRRWWQRQTVVQTAIVVVYSHKKTNRVKKSTGRVPDKSRDEHSKCPQQTLTLLHGIIIRRSRITEFPGYYIFPIQRVFK